MPNGEIASHRGLSLSFLPRPLLEPRRPTRAILTAWATAFLPTALVGALITFLMPDARQPVFNFGPGELLFRVVLIAPVAETLVMGIALLILLRFFNPVVAVLVSAIGWGLLHSLAVPIWGLVIWWPFLIFSTLFVTWRRRSLVAAFAVPAVAHACHNLLPALALAFAQP